MIIRSVWSRSVRLRSAWSRGVFAALLSALLFGANASALSVSPLSVSLGTAGADASGSLTVRNDRDRPMPVSVEMLRLDKESDRLVPGDDLLLAFPPQVILEPGASQVIRFQWLGDPEIAATEAFYAVIQEVPVVVQPDASARAGVGAPIRAQIEMTVAFRIAVLVTPDGATSEFTIDRVEHGLNADGASFLTLWIRNVGNGFGRLGERELVLRNANGDSAVLGSPDFPTSSSVLRTLILPGATRRVSFPAPDSAWSSGVTAEIR